MLLAANNCALGKRNLPPKLEAVVVLLQTPQFRAPFELNYVSRLQFQERRARNWTAIKFFFISLVKLIVCDSFSSARVVRTHSLVVHGLRFHVRKDQYNQLRIQLTLSAECLTQCYTHISAPQLTMTNLCGSKYAHSRAWSI